MTSRATSDTESFTLHYRPEQHLRVSHWLRPVSPAELKARYAALLDAAVATGNCRHWLLGVCRRDVHNAEAIAWLADFAPTCPRCWASPWPWLTLPG